MVDSVITLEGLFDVLLYTETEYDSSEDKMNYYFVTNATSTCPAKSPIGMFDRETQIRIPNDLAIVVEAIDRYEYGE